MKPTRRHILAGLSAIAVAPGCRGGKTDEEALDSADAASVPTPERDPEPEPWSPDPVLDEGAFPLGVQVGDPDTDGVVIIAWTTEPVVGLMLAQGEDGVWVAPDPTPVIDTDALVPVDGRVQLTLTGLRPDAVYSICFTSEDLLRRSRVTRFRTALGPDDWRVLTLAATSCLGTPGRPWANMSYAAASDPDAFLLLGDTVYANGAYTTDQFLAYYRDALAVEGLAEASAHSALVAIWDDHELINNFAGEASNPGLYAEALAAFRQAIPQRTGPGGNGLWRSLSWGPVAELVMMDCRSERQGEEQYISSEQMEWVKSTLLESSARFKLILNSVPITDYTPMFGSTYDEDRWQGFPAQREEILSFIEEEGIEGVVWITGDFHMGVISRVDPAGGLADSSWEIMVGPAGSTLNVLATLYENPEQFPVMFAQYNSALLRLDPGLGTIVVTYLGDDGTVLAEQTVEV